MTPTQKEMIRAIAQKATDARRALYEALRTDLVGPHTAKEAHDAFEAIRNEANLLLASTLPPALAPLPLPKRVPLEQAQIGAGTFYLDADCTGGHSHSVYGARRAIEKAAEMLRAAGQGQVGIYRGGPVGEFVGFVLKDKGEPVMFEVAQ